MVRDAGCVVPGNIGTTQAPLSGFAEWVAAIVALFADEKPGDVAGLVQWQYDHVFTAAPTGFDHHYRIAAAECIAFHFTTSQQQAG